MRSSSVSVLVTVLVACAFVYRASAAGQRGPQPARPTSAPTFLSWPLPATAKAYGGIDGKRLWQYVKEKGDTAERYREQGHPQFWGIIAGTSGDVEDAQWLIKKYQQIGLTDTRIQPVAFFHPQWAPESWDVTMSAGGKAVTLASAQPPYAAASTDGKVLDVPVAYVGLGSDADFAGRDVRGKAVPFFRERLGYNIGPADVLQRARDNGAAAIFASDFRGGNYNLQSYRASSTIPTFNLGTQDAVLLRESIAKAPAGDSPRVKIRLDAKWAKDQKSFLVWGTLPGATDETIYVIAKSMSDGTSFLCGSSLDPFVAAWRSASGGHPGWQNQHQFEVFEIVNGSCHTERWSDRARMSEIGARLPCRLTPLEKLCLALGAGFLRLATGLYSTFGVWRARRFAGRI